MGSDVAMWLYLMPVNTIQKCWGRISNVLDILPQLKRETEVGEGKAHAVPVFLPRSNLSLQRSVEPLSRSGFGYKWGLQQPEEKNRGKGCLEAYRHHHAQVRRCSHRALQPCNFAIAYGMA